ncbi:MAG: glycosyltransferase family 2 protein [Bacteroidota bacterium]
MKINDLSVIVPVRDEASNIPVLTSRLKQTLTAMNHTFEIIFVTDFNRDDTIRVLRREHESDGRVKFLKLSRSHGQHVAVFAGLQASSGRYAVIMDGDLQDEPEDIPLLYEMIRSGYDIVYGVKETKNESALRNLVSRAFLHIISNLSDVRMDFNTSMFRIISRKTIDEVLKYREIEPSLTFIMGSLNLPTEKVLVASGKRFSGKTKYNFRRQMSLAITSLLSFSTRPIEYVSMLGLVISLISFIYFIIVIIQRVFEGIGVLGWPTIIALITLLGGMQLFAIGIIGQYIGKIFLQTKNRPLYVVEEQVGLNDKTE